MIPLRNYLELFLLAAIWSSAFMGIKVAIVDVPPLTLAAIRTVIASSILYGFMKWRGQTLRAGRRDWGLMILIGVFNYVLPFYLIGWGEQVVDSGLTAILMAVMPLLTIVMAHFATVGEKLSWSKITGVSVGFGGVIILIGPTALGGVGDHFWREMAIAFSAACYATATIFAVRGQHIPASVRAAGSTIAGAIMLVPLALLIDQPFDLTVGTRSLLAVLYLSVFPTAIGVIIYFHLIAQRGATFTALNNYIIPILGLVWGWLFLDETFGLEVFAALLMILTGIWLTNKQKKN